MSTMKSKLPDLTQSLSVSVVGDYCRKAISVIENRLKTVRSESTAATDYRENLFFFKTLIGYLESMEEKTISMSFVDFDFIYRWSHPEEFTYHV